MGNARGRLDRFDEAKFGMFVHWGPYSVAGVEASWPVMLGPELQRRFVEALHRFGVEEVSMPPHPITLDAYEALPQRFDPVAFDAGAWVDLARAAGQRYLVLTTKHHDGFAMFDTGTTDYRITATPFGRDVTAELAGACAAGGIGFGAYFSAPDFHDPGYRDLARHLPECFLGQPERPEWAGFLDRMEAQVREVASRYGELFSWWWDIGFGPQWPIERFHRLVRELQPGAVMNDRLGGLAPGIDPELAADFLTPEQSIPRSIPRRSTFDGPMDPTLVFALIQRDDWEAAIEQIAPVVRAHFDAPADPTVPPPGDLLPWEACMTFGGQWAWNPELARCKTGDEIIVDLVEVASRGGNLLLNVGPRPDGTIQPEFEAALRTVGAWLADRGEAIYGTTYGPVQGQPDLRSTADDRHVHLHLLGGAPAPVRVPLAGQVSAGRVLGSGAPVALAVEGDDVVVDLGRAPRHPVVTTVTLDRI